MADSNITKRALAASLKVLLEIEPLEKISVGAICEGCGMNRKSFYYHFHDKFELIEWIYDTEFIEVVQGDPSARGWDLIERLFRYYHANRTFYRKTLQYQGQNSPEGYFRDVAAAVLARSLAERSLIDPQGAPDFADFAVDFYSNAVTGAVRRWILSENPLPPDRFSKYLFDCLYVLPVTLRLQDKREREAGRQRTS